MPDIKVEGIDQLNRIIRNALMTGAWIQSNSPAKIAGVTFGKHTQKVFNKQGKYGDGYGWQELSANTQAVRTARGYDPRKPILVQSGDLKRAAADTLASGGLSESGNKVAMRASAVPKLFSAEITGPKVENQFGGSIAGFGSIGGGSATRFGGGYLPARPFWNLNQTAMDSISQAIMTSVLRRWR